MRCFTISAWRCVTVFAFGLSLLVLAGCQADTSPFKGPKGTVKGKVTYKGNPLPAGCAVVFMHETKSLPATGSIGADGTYSLMMGGKPEVLAGAYKVSLTPPASVASGADPSNPEAYKAFMMGKGAKSTVEKPPFPQKYRMAETSGLTFTVKEGPNTFDIELKD